ncbi:MAG: sigma-70 family RNA polymerase sigma factor [Planctomycetes bacterium]|nr:sigma-70 family RNA polymerase sigma factor [Planctomycetota bacterium]
MTESLDHASVDDRSLWSSFIDDGDRVALAQFIDRHGKCFLAAAMAITHNYSDAEDALQMAVERVMELPGEKLQAAGDIRAWMVGIVKNCARQIIRDETRLRARYQRAQEYNVVQATIDVEEQEQAHEHQEILHALQECLHELPEKYQESVSLHYLQGMTFKDIGTSLGRSESVVKKQAQRGIQKLRDKLKRRGLSVGAILLVSLLQKLSADEYTACNRIGEIVHCLRVSEAFPAQVPAYQAISPLRFAYLMCIVSTLVIGTVIIVLSRAEQKTAQTDVSESAIELPDKNDKQVHVPNTDDEWLYLTNKDILESDGIMEKYEDIVAGTSDQRFADQAQVNKKGKAYWFVDSFDGKNFIQLMLRQPVESSEYEIRLSYRVLQQTSEQPLLALGLLMRQSKEPAERNIININDRLRDTARDVGDWREVRIHVRDLQREGKVWSRVEVLVNDELFSDIEIAIPSTAVCSPLAQVGLSLEVKDLRIRVARLNL